MYKYIFFDLDGTLTNSMEGIIKSLEYAFDSMGIPKPDEATLKKFIGPPLTVSFHELMGFDDETSDALIKKYRERYLVKGIYENAPFDGIKHMLKKAGESGKTLAVATSKPEKMSLTVTDYFGLTDYFATVSGSADESEDKAAVILKACERLNIPKSDYRSILMVGDRKHDIIGAHKCSVKCCGVRYGFAPEGELREYGADYIVDTVKDLEEFLCGETDFG